MIKWRSRKSVMSIKSFPKVRRQNSEITEPELQAKYKNSKNEIVQTLLAARREHLRENGKFLTDKEINRELKR